jgi:hypothetical protein
LGRAVGMTDSDPSVTALTDLSPIAINKGAC